MRVPRSISPGQRPICPVGPRRKMPSTRTQASFLWLIAALFANVDVPDLHTLLLKSDLYSGATAAKPDCPPPDALHSLLLRASARGIASSTDRLLLSSSP